MLAEHASAFHADGGAAGVVVGAGSEPLGIVDVAVARVVVTGHDVHAARIGGIGPLQHRVNIGDLDRRGNARPGLLNELIGPDLQAAATLAGIALEFLVDPLRRCVDALIAAGRRVGRERLPGVEADQLLDGLLDAAGRDVAQGGSNLRVGS